MDYCERQQSMSTHSSLWSSRIDTETTYYRIGGGALLTHKMRGESLSLLYLLAIHLSCKMLVGSDSRLVNFELPCPRLIMMMSYSQCTSAPYLYSILCLTTQKMLPPPLCSSSKNNASRYPLPHYGK